MNKLETVLGDLGFKGKEGFYQQAKCGGLILIVEVTDIEDGLVSIKGIFSFEDQNKVKKEVVVRKAVCEQAAILVAHHLQQESARVIGDFLRTNL